MTANFIQAGFHIAGVLYKQSYLRTEICETEDIVNEYLCGRIYVRPDLRGLDWLVVRREFRPEITAPKIFVCCGVLSARKIHEKICVLKRTVQREDTWYQNSNDFVNIIYTHVWVILGNC